MKDVMWGGPPHGVLLAPPVLAALPGSPRKAEGPEWGGWAWPGGCPCGRGLPAPRTGGCALRVPRAAADTQCGSDHTLAAFLTRCPSVQGLFVLLFHCVLNREVRKHLKGVLAGKKPHPDDSATTRATLLTVGGPQRVWAELLTRGLSGCVDQASDVAPWCWHSSRGASQSCPQNRMSSLIRWGLSEPQPCFLRSYKGRAQQARTPNRSSSCGGEADLCPPQGTRNGVLWASSSSCALCPAGALSECQHWGLLWGQSHPGGLCSASNQPPSPSAPSTATPPTARSPPCCARPWGRAPPRWTAPSGRPLRCPAVLPGRGWQILASSPLSQAYWEGFEPCVLPF